MTGTQRFYLMVLIILLGLLIRFFGPFLHVPAFFVKYGGSTLWALMVYVLVTIALPGKPFRAGVIAFGIAVVVEFFRLVRTDWLDQFRTTLAGALLVGRHFSYADIVAYGAAIAFGMLVDLRFFNRR